MATKPPPKKRAARKPQPKVQVPVVLHATRPRRSAMRETPPSVAELLVRPEHGLGGLEQMLSDTREGVLARGSLTRYNPDQLVRRKGGLRVYDEMVVDDQIKACLFLKTAAIIGPGWTIDPPEDSDDATVADALKEELLTLQADKTFTGILSELLRTGLSYGFAVAEKILEPPDLRIVTVKPRAPHHIEFEQDAYGNILALKQMQGGGQVGLDPKRFLRFTNNGDFDNPYGCSDLRAAYTPWWHKKAWVQFLAIWGEKLATTPVVAKHPEVATGTKVDYVMEQLEKLQAGSAMAVPEGWDVVLLESTRNVQDVFVGVIQHLNLSIGRAILVPEKLGFSGGDTSGGSYALSQTQLGAFFFVLGLLGEELDAAVQRSLIRPICDLRWPGRPCPRFRRMPLSEENKLEIAKVWKDLAMNGTVLSDVQDENQLRSMLGFQTVEESDAEMRASLLAKKQEQEQVQQDLERQALDGGPPDDDDGGGEPGEKPPKKEFAYNPSQLRHPQGTKQGGRFAPMAGVSAPISTDGWEKIGGQAGSNPGGFFRGPDGTDYYVKKGKSESHVRNELTANALYRDLGVGVPQLHEAKLSADMGGGIGVASKMEKGFTPAGKMSGEDFNQRVGLHKYGLVVENQAAHDAFVDGFVADAFLSNWDAVGTGKDNLGFNAEGKMLRIDAGGSLKYRAQGGDKGAKFGNEVMELQTLRDPAMNKDAASVFGKLSDAAVAQGVQRFAGKMSEQQIRDRVAETWPGKEGKAMADTLVKRRAHMLAQHGITDPFTGKKPKTGVGIKDDDKGVGFAPTRLPNRRHKVTEAAAASYEAEILAQYGGGATHNKLHQAAIGDGVAASEIRNWFGEWNGSATHEGPMALRAVAAWTHGGAVPGPGGTARSSSAVAGYRDKFTAMSGARTHEEAYAKFGRMVAVQRQALWQSLGKTGPVDLDAKVTLYRGQSFPTASVAGKPLGKRMAIRTGAAASYSFNRATAEKFAYGGDGKTGVVVRAEVSFRNILGSHKAWWGTDYEAEVIVNDRRLRGIIVRLGHEKLDDSKMKKKKGGFAETFNLNGTPSFDELEIEDIDDVLDFTTEWESFFFPHPAPSKDDPVFIDPATRFPEEDIDTDEGDESIDMIERDIPTHFVDAQVPSSYWRVLRPLEARADMREKQATFEESTDKLGIGLSLAMQGMLVDLRARIDRMDWTAHAVQKLKMNAAKSAVFRKQLEEGLSRAYDRGAKDARSEVRRARSDLHERLDHANLVGTKARAFFRAKSFTVTAKVTSDVLAKAKAVLYNALRQDKTDSQTMYELDQVLHDYIPKVDAANRKVNVPHRIETIARTNIAEAVNEGRWATFTDPDLEGFVEGFEYSAVLDDRTRASHRAWDGVRLPVDHPAWRAPTDNRPPNGFNCRCLLVPVTAADAPTWSEAPSRPAADVGFK